MSTLLRLHGVLISAVMLWVLATSFSSAGSPVAWAQEPEPTATRPPVLPLETPTVVPTVTPTMAPEPTTAPMIPEPSVEAPTSEPITLLPESGATIPLNRVIIATGALCLIGGAWVAQHEKRLHESNYGVRKEEFNGNGGADRTDPVPGGRGQSRGADRRQHRRR